MSLAKGTAREHHSAGSWRLDKQRTDQEFRVYHEALLRKGGLFAEKFGCILPLD